MSIKVSNNKPKRTPKKNTISVCISRENAWSSPPHMQIAAVGKNRHNVVKTLALLALLAIWDHRQMDLINRIADLQRYLHLPLTVQSISPTFPNLSPTEWVQNNTYNSKWVVRRNCHFDSFTIMQHVPVNNRFSF